MYDLLRDEHSTAEQAHAASSLLGFRPRKGRLSHIALIGNYPPRQCGIATFTADVRTAMLGAANQLKVDVVAMSDGEDIQYGAAVDHVVRQNEISDYLAVARRLNESGVELACVQHEFGIFGGPAGDYLLILLENLRCPVVVVLHTVLDDPNDDQRRVMAALLRRSAKVVVMAERGRQILRRAYHAPADKVVVIPHGTPDFPFVRPDSFKAKLGLEGREVMLTFGLLSPNKGLESVIRALPEIVRERPNALYVVLGATHPKLVQREGEAYRDSLSALAEQLGVGAHLKFVNAYVGMDELLGYLAAADVYVTPYLNERQITSGTLSYAVALGKPVVSTPYWHAVELLANDVGMLVGFNDSPGFAAALTSLLSNPEKRQQIAERAYEKGREMIWARSGERYIETLVAAAGAAVPKVAPAAASPPKPDLRAILRMTDSCGIFQHARHNVPDRRHGYCVDDNARALILMHYARKAGVRDGDIETLSATYASFVDHAWNEDAGRFRNFMGYQRNWLEDAGSLDSFGRSLWALGETARLASNGELRAWAQGLADRVIPHVKGVHALHALSFCALGLASLANARREDAQWRAALTHCGETLNGALSQTRRPGWFWFKSTLCYDNARLPQGLIAAGRVLAQPEWQKNGLAALAWLAEIQTGPTGCFMPVGNESFGAPYAAPAPFDQQPLEAAAMVEACLDAADLSGAAEAKAFWREEAERAYAWYFGGNILGARMVTADGAGCFDGLSRQGPNRNQGAESILALQTANCMMKTRACVQDQTRLIARA
jgi:glycosyltransferase involved in cell wall biosynthesis